MAKETKQSWKVFINLDLAGGGIVRSTGELSMPTVSELGGAVIQECRQKLNTTLSQLRKCLLQLTEQEIWSRPNEHSNSVGNLVLHLTGNVRQYVISGLGHAADVRERAQEFTERGPIPTAQLLEHLEQTMAEADQVLARLDAESLLEKRSVQGFEKTGLNIVITVASHFCYHVGQVTYFVKASKNLDLGYYAGIDLNKKSR